jgi:outer membrane protein TolC
MMMAMGLGCAHDQAADVSAYRAISDPPGPVASLEPGAPLSLVDALRLTAFHNESLAIEGERYIQALAARQRAASLLLPSFDFFTNLALRENTGDDGVVQTDAGATGQYRLLTGLSDLRNVDAAAANADAARWLILDLRESLLVQSAFAYYETLRAERLAQVLDASVIAQTERLADARARNEVGFARALDVSQIESQVSRSRAQLILAQRRAGEARKALALLTNAPVATSPLTDQFIPREVVPHVEDLVHVAASRRQDVLAARADVDAARALVDAAIAQYAPSIGINVDYFLWGGPDEPEPNIGSLLVLRVPLFTARRIEADVQRSWSVFREAVLVYRARVREVRRDVKTAHLRLRTSTLLGAELATQVRVASQAVDLAEAAYEAGIGTNLERVVAQDQLLAAELEAVSEAFTTKAAYMELLRACGMLSADVLNTPFPSRLTPDHDGSTPPQPPDSPFLDRDPAQPRSTSDGAPT